MNPYKIIAPESFLSQVTELYPVVYNSKLIFRQYVEKFAKYFRREMRFDFTQFQATGENYYDKRKYVAYLFNPKGYYAGYSIGACCFRWRTFTDKQIWGLQWIWIHPYARQKGLLKKYWKEFKLRHAPFYVEPPLSDIMNTFLTKYNNETLLVSEPDIHNTLETTMTNTKEELQSLYEEYPKLIYK
jgi:hypothetical protein